MTLLSIGQIAKQTGVTVETLRFYEKQQLLEVAARSAAGYRQFLSATIKRVLFIQHAKAVGFTLNEIRDLLNLQRTPGTSCNDIKHHAQQKIELIDNKIHELKHIRDALTRMVLKCTTDTALTDCPILNELEMKYDEHSEH